jgi:peptidoglycan hydrolase CwlO-like protein
MNQEILGLMNKDIDKLMSDVSQLGKNMNQLVELLDGLTARVLQMEDSQVAMEDAILKIAAKLRDDAGTAVAEVDVKRDGKEL